MLLVSRMTLAFLLLLGVASFGAVGPTLADDDPVIVGQGIIGAQIQAFLNDDADKAYSFASPAIQHKFVDKDKFFDMVRKSYSPVYRPGNYAFGRSKIMGDYLYQEVIISGNDGKDRTAIYGLQKQPDGSYRINGVQIMDSADSKGI